MRRYIFYSSSAHLLLAGLLFAIMPKTLTKQVKHYYVDFIGETRVETVQNSTPAQEKKSAKEKVEKEKILAKAATVKTPENFDTDDFFRDTAPLKPSLAGESSKLLEENTAQETASPGESGINTDSDFPYPWYITQIREALWDSWRKRMPASATIKCVVRFRIGRDGRILESELEKSSGNRLFDYAAVSSVETVGKLPPLPNDFFEDSLVIHVEFKNLGL